MELNCVRLLVDDFDKCYSFYKDSLKLHCSWGELGGSYASFDIGRPACLSLYKRELMSQSINTSNLPIQERGQDSFAIIIKTNNVDEVYKSLFSNHVIFINTPIDMAGWGMRVVHLRDPEGNLIELWSELNKDKWDEELKSDSLKYE